MEPRPLGRHGLGESNRQANRLMWMAASIVIFIVLAGIVAHVAGAL